MDKLKCFILCRMARKTWHRQEFFSISRDIFLAFENNSEQALERLIFRLLPEEFVPFPRKLKPNPQKPHVEGWIVCGKVFEMTENSACVVEDGWGYVSDDDVETDEEIDYVMAKRPYINRRRGAFFGTLLLFVGRARFEKIRGKNIFPADLDILLEDASKSDFKL